MRVKLFKIFAQYPVYLFVGAGVTLLTVLVRSLIGFLIQDDTTAKYIASIVLSYIVGILLSYFAHRTITFRDQAQFSLAQTLKFVGAHLLGMILSLFISIHLRAYLLDAWMPIEISKLLAFTIAALIVSIVTFLLKKYVVFEKA
ncbi:GtrA family protein [Leptolyngbya sp. AN03gr2]|uniref:GtrA family protein n=1 Tax=unclassified Leptolyngbya TaxID=2650499 RepID=UPI003D313ECE